jgi:hypothetical protein
VPKLRSLRFDEYNGDLREISFTYPAAPAGLTKQDNYEKYVSWAAMSKEEREVLTITLEAILDANKEETV